MKGPGLWKMNCSLLDDEDYVNDITEKITIWSAEGRKEYKSTHNSAFEKKTTGEK